MKKSIQLFFLLATAVLVFSAGKEASARTICSTATTSSNTGNCYTRTTNPPTNDIWAVGGYLQGGVPKTFSEVTLDYTGSLLPTSTLGTQNLGSSSLPWLNLYATTVTPGSGGIVLPAAAPLVLPPQTTTQIQLEVHPIGTLYTIQERVSGSLVTNLYNQGMSTANVVASCVYTQVSTSAVAAVGASCAN